jgi:hypothetical protein
MAEDVGVKIPGEGDGGHSLNPETQRAAQVAAAGKSGWRPLEEFEGDPADWVDAPEFLGRQKLYDQIHDLKREIKKQSGRFDREMAKVSGHFEKMQEQAYSRAKADLEAQHTLAVEEQDAGAAKAAKDGLAQLEVNHAAAKATQAQPSQEQTVEFQTWRGDNKWFDSDVQLQREAISIGIGYAYVNPNMSQTDVLDYVTTKMKAMYPEKFGEAPLKKEGRRMPASVEAGGLTPQGGTGTKGKSKTLTFADLNDSERKIFTALKQRRALDKLATKNKRSVEDEFLSQMTDLRADQIARVGR